MSFDRTFNKMGGTMLLEDNRPGDIIGRKDGLQNGKVDFLRVIKGVINGL